MGHLIFSNARPHLPVSKEPLFWPQAKKKPMTSTVLDFLLVPIEAFHAALQVTVIMQTRRSKTLNVSWLELWLVLQHFFFNFFLCFLLPHSSLQINPVFLPVF